MAPAVGPDQHGDARLGLCPLWSPAGSAPAPRASWARPRQRNSRHLYGRNSSTARNVSGSFGSLNGDSMRFCSRGDL
jgi:hypothetical protein